MDKVIAIGIDLAKNIVSVHGQNEQGKAIQNIVCFANGILGPTITTE